MLKISCTFDFLLDLLISVDRIKKWNTSTFLYYVPQGRLYYVRLYVWCLLIKKNCWVFLRGGSVIVMIYSTNLCCGTCGRHRLILTFISDKSVIFLINKDRQLLQAYALTFSPSKIKNLNTKLLCQIIWIPIFQCVSACTNVHIRCARQTKVHIRTVDVLILDKKSSK